MRQLARVCIEPGTFCPGFQFRPDLSLNPVVVGLFDRVMELGIPYNYFALWMMMSCPVLGGARPVDQLERSELTALLAAMERTLARAVA